MSGKGRTPYDGSDPMDRAAGWAILILFLSFVGLPTLYGLAHWALWELFGPWGAFG